jgi:hypothetical protein
MFSLWRQERELPLYSAELACHITTPGERSEDFLKYYDTGHRGPECLLILVINTSLTKLLLCAG